MNIVLDLRAIYGHFAGTLFIQPRLASVNRGSPSMQHPAQALITSLRTIIYCNIICYYMALYNIIVYIILASDIADAEIQYRPD